MKERMQGFIAGILLVVIVASGVVFAQQINKTAELCYSNIKVIIDGEELLPRDVEGNVVEPFTMDGTTYLPVRAIANAFGKEVGWDEVSQSVYINSPQGYAEEYHTIEVYRTPSGKRYHLDSDCGGTNSYQTTLEDAIEVGLTPCKKCAR